MPSRFTRIIFTLALCWLLPASSFVRAEGVDAGEVYLRGYALKNEGEKLEAAGKFPEALNAYKQAQTIITSVAQNSPAWQPEVVQYRLQALQQTIARLSLRVPAGSQIPAPQLPTAVPPPAGMAPANVATAPAPAAATDPISAIQQEMARKDETIKDLEGRLKTYADAYLGAAQARQKAEGDLMVLRRQLEGVEQKLDAVQNGKDSKTSAALKELEQLKLEAAAVKDMIQGKDTTIAESKKMAEEANKATDALKKEKDDLLAQVAKLQGENKELQSRITSMGSDGGKGGDFAKLLAENARLKKDLEDTRKQVEDLKTSGTRKDAEIAQLKTQLSTIQGELTKLQNENTAYQQQVADLTLKLKEMGTGLAANGQSKESAGDSKLADENKMLRTIIMRQLRQQDRQRQAKELVIAEMKKMKNTSQSLMTNLEEMTSAKIMLTVDEESLFTAPELKELISANAVRATLTATSSKTKVAQATGTTAGKTGSADTGAEAKLLEKAASALEKGDRKGAESAYTDLLRANPKNVAARSDLAALKLQMKNYDAAEVELKKCLVYEPENDVAHYRLGVCYFQQNRMGDARIEMEKSLSRNSSNARAHHYMGIIENKLGRRDLAETEFKKALAIDPSYGDAHFNLAVLYATAEPPQWDLANKHYQDALSRGIKADPALEKLLTKPAEAPVEAKKEAPAAVSAR